MNSSSRISRRNTVLTPAKSWISSRGAPAPGECGFGSLGMSACGFVGSGNFGCRGDENSRATIPGVPGRPSRLLGCSGRKSIGSVGGKFLQSQIPKGNIGHACPEGLQIKFQWMDIKGRAVPMEIPGICAAGGHSQRWECYFRNNSPPPTLMQVSMGTQME